MRLPAQIFNSLSFALLVAVAWVSAALRDLGGETHVFSETSHKPYNGTGRDSEHSHGEDIEGSNSLFCCCVYRQRRCTIESTNGGHAANFETASVSFFILEDELGTALLFPRKPSLSGSWRRNCCNASEQLYKTALMSTSATHRSGLTKASFGPA